MKLLQTSAKWTDWWKGRKIDWNTHYTATWTHPHRKAIVAHLARLPFLSLLEIGCGSGPNLIAIVKNLKGKQLAGVDINEDAIALAKKTFPNGMFKVGRADDVMMSDKSVDVVLTDMCLIYTDKGNIEKHLREIKRLARNFVVFCEFHSAKWMDRLKLKFKEGYSAYDYKKLLEKQGFYDIYFYKIKPEDWPTSDLQPKYAYIIIAKVPKR